MPDDDKEVVRAEEAPAIEQHESLAVDEIRRLEDELRPLVEPTVRQEVRAANAAIGIADELTRLVLAFVLGAAVLLLLAVVLTPWLWIASGAWIVSAIWTVVVLTRRRRRGAAPAIKP